MSSHSNPTAATGAQALASRINGLAARLKRWWVAYTAWRVEQFAVGRLNALSDRELRLLGIGRPVLERVDCAWEA